MLSRGVESAVAVVCWHQQIYTIGDVNNNVVNIKVLLSVSSVLLPFLMPDTCRGEFQFFFHTKENGSARPLAAIIVEHPLPCSGRIPCQALLTPARVYWFPRVAPARARCLFENTCEQGDTQALVRVSESASTWSITSAPQPHSFQFPKYGSAMRRNSAPCKRSASALGAGDVTVTRQIVPRFLTTSSCQCLGVYCCVGPVVQPRLLCQCDCYLAMAELESF